MRRLCFTLEKMKSFGMILCIVVFGTQVILAESMEQQFAKANQYYKDKQYDFAESAYLNLLKSDKNNTPILFNLANTYFHKKDYVQAVYYYERAAKYQPDDKTIQHNIQMTNAILFKKQEFSSTFFLIKIVHNWVYSSASAQWAKIAIFFLWLTAIAFVFYFLRKNQFAYQMGILSIFASVLFFIFTYLVYQNEHTSNYAIALQNALVKKTPVATGNTSDTLQAGIKVKLIDSDKDWQKVELPNDKQGWVPTVSIRKI